MQHMCTWVKYFFYLSTIWVKISAKFLKIKKISIKNGFSMQICKHVKWCNIWKSDFPMLQLFACFYTTSVTGIVLINYFLDRQCDKKCCWVMVLYSFFYVLSPTWIYSDVVRICSLLPIIEQIITSTQTPSLSLSLSHTHTHT